MTTPWVYIAGPYTNPDPGANTHQMAKDWDRIQSFVGDAAVIINPLWSHLQHLIVPRPYQFWIDYDLNLIRMLAANGPGFVYRIPGESTGADGEVGLARELGVPIVYSDEELFRELDLIHDE